MELVECSEVEMGRAWALNLPPVECQLQLPPATDEQSPVSQTCRDGQECNK